MWGIVIVRTPEPEQAEYFYLWPENALTWSVWLSLQTQWRTNAGGEREGLDYAAIDSELLHGSCRVRRKDFRRVRSELQLMEHAALRTWRAAARRR